MIKPMFSVFDAKARVFATPFVSTNVDTATRDFHRAALDPQTDLNRFPDDYILYEIASYDDSTATISHVTPPNYICNAKQFQEG